MFVFEGDDDGVRYCQAPGCEATTREKVAVSLRSEGDSFRWLCSSHKQAYEWGVEHGRACVIYGGPHGEFGPPPERPEYDELRTAFD